jgi:hypothetical protein
VSEEDRSPNRRAELYERLKPVYEAFVDKLEDHLEERLDDVGVSYSWIASWTRGVAEYESLLFRNLKTGRSDESTGAGVHVVTHNTSYFDAIIKVIDEEFLVDSGAWDPAQRPDRPHAYARDDVAPIEYSYPRYVVRLTDERCVLPEWKPYQGLRVEIDVMTVLQYAWERTDEHLSYYWAGSYPSPIRTLLDDAIGHFVAADGVLTEVETLADTIEQEYIEAIRHGDVDLELNGDSLRSYLCEAEVVSSLVAAGIEAGMRREDEYDLAWRFAEELLWVLRVSDIETLPELDRFLQDASDRAPELLRQIVLLSGERDFVPWAVSDSIVMWLLLVLRRADDATVELTQQHQGLQYALNTLIGNQVASDDRPANDS